jgi:MoxR-like ATPase
VLEAAGRVVSRLGPTAELDDLRGAQARIASRVVGRERELELVLAAVASGRDIVLEGAPGTSKTTMLKAITAEWGLPLLLVEGNADLTPTKLIGHHPPSAVLREGYTAESFVPGPLTEAMQKGGFLYIEELNRAPDDTLNTLLMAMADRELAIPRFGAVRALSTFRVVGSMNPFDNVGTTRLSASILDRFCRLVVDYQDEAAECEVVRRRVPDDAAPVPLAPVLVQDAVRVVRATRSHPDLRMGSSVRGAIDVVHVAARLCALRGIEVPADPGYRDTVLDAVLVALSGRIHVDEAAERTPEDVLHEIWAALANAGSPAAPG